MAAHRILVPVFVLAFACTTQVAHAGTTGKLTGLVLNENKEPLAGVTIRIDGARLGAVTDEGGRYFVIVIPAGTYAVHANLLGYGTLVTEQVSIQPDFTTTLDLVLKTEAVQMAEVKVEAQRPLLQKDATGTTRFISADEMQRLPTRGYREATVLQSGVVNYRRQPDRLLYVFEGGVHDQSSLMVRGGRANETAYFVDGFSQQDPLSGTSSTAISNNAIEEVVVLTGGPRPRKRRGAELLRLVFAVDVETCGRCGGAMRIVAFVTEPAVVRRGCMLTHLERRGVGARAGPWAGAAPG